jgi:Fe-S cluster assembly iron-binding protein IscA
MKGMVGMIFLTEQAVTKLKVLILEHPEDPFVRLMVRDLDEARLSYNITLEDKIQPDDEVQEVKGLTVAVEGRSAPRMQGITLDYQEPDGFKFIHPEQEEDPKLDVFNWN